MLIPCRECGQQISDQAIICPHCGIEVNRAVKRKKYHRKRKRLPNGFGQITEIKNQNLRKPFRAMVSYGKNEEGKPICKLLQPNAYFETYNEAYSALLEYNRTPYDLSQNITMEELYKRWQENHSKKVGKQAAAASASAWDYCSSIKKCKVSEIRQRHVKACMEDGRAVRNGALCSPTAATKRNIKSLLNMMLDYAMEYELVTTNYARQFDLPSEVTKEISVPQRRHIAFTDEEMQKLWKNAEKIKYADILLYQCYSGWRPQELGKIEVRNVDLSNNLITGGLKTEAGKNRTVPIHHSVLGIVEKYYKHAIEINSIYLFNYQLLHRAGERPLTYQTYLSIFNEVCSSLNLNPNHRPHDGRKHFVTMAKKNKVDEYAIKYLVGHTITDITERVYTERDLTWLQSEIEKIK